MIIIVFFAFIAVFGPMLAPYEPLGTDSRQRLQGPSAAHWFGTDNVGRDVLTRTMYGARVSIYAGLMSMIGAAGIGAIVGVTSGYLGGKFDLLVQRLVDGLTAFPTLLLALALMAAWGATLNNVILAMSITFAPRITRVVRSAALSAKENPYIEAARAIGAASPRVILRHILPNTFAALIVIATASVGAMIITEASLSFLGVGTPARVVTWGAMLSGDALTFFSSAPWVGIFPGGALSLVVFGINVFGDSLRDILDPKMRGR